MSHRDEWVDAMRRTRPVHILYTYDALPETAAQLRAYGMQNGLFLSLDMIRRFFMPSLKRHYDLARRHRRAAFRRRELRRIRPAADTYAMPHIRRD
jgi:hypothetical protein